MRDLLETINLHCGWECLIKTYDGWSLSLHSGTSVEHAKPLVVFSDVSYVSCALEF